MLSEYKMEKANPLPFSGGLFGYFSYDLKDVIEELKPLSGRKTSAKPATDTPLAQIGLYDAVFVHDHVANESWVASYGIKRLYRETQRPCKESDADAPHGVDAGAPEPGRRRTVHLRRIENQIQPLERRILGHDKKSPRLHSLRRHLPDKPVEKAYHTDQKRPVRNLLFHDDPRSVAFPVLFRLRRIFKYSPTLPRKVFTDYGTKGRNRAHKGHKTARQKIPFKTKQRLKNSKKAPRKTRSTS